MDLTATTRLRRRKAPPTRESAGKASSRQYRRFIPHHFLTLLGKQEISEIKPGDNAELNMTILFSDIRDFTSLAESMTPQETFKLINAYFREMEPAIFMSNGFIDKFIGDAIMGIFPRRADDAMAAALTMLKRLRAFNDNQRRNGLPVIETGIGLNTGLAIAGAVGGRHRVETTVIGDTVNLASRIEPLTKTYGAPLLISEHVLYSLKEPDKHDIRFIDRIRIRGKEQPQSVYEVFDADPRNLRMAKRRSKSIFEDALAHYHCQDISVAHKLLDRCLALCPEDHAARVYADRCRRFAATGIHEGTGEIGMPVVWDDSCSVNQPEIDDQHRELFAAANKFISNVREAKEDSQIEQLTAFLSGYINRHFQSEERIMREKKYPLLAFQKQQHARFRRNFAFLENELRKKFSTQKTYMLFKIRCWLSTGS